MRNTVLIVAPVDDAHALAVGRILETDFGVSVMIWDSTGFPSADTFTYRPTNAGIRLRVGNRRIASDSLISIWARRLSSFTLAPFVTNEQVRAFCRRECHTLFLGALDAAAVPVVNNPKSELAATRKPLQLAVAAKVGFCIPRTVMSNDAEEIRQFVDEIGGSCVYKAFTPSPIRMSETRILRCADLEDLDKLMHAPIIVQERIEGSDIRVNVFGRRVLAAEVHPSITDDDIDWRLDMAAKWRQHDLPEVEGARAMKLVCSLGLQYGCLDLRRSVDGVYFFLEVNPSGQFLFIEIDTEQPLTQSFAELLLQPSEAYPSNARVQGAVSGGNPDI